MDKHSAIMNKNSPILKLYAHIIVPRSQEHQNSVNSEFESTIEGLEFNALWVGIPEITLNCKLMQFSGSSTGRLKSVDVQRTTTNQTFRGLVCCCTNEHTIHQ